ncbi:uncharacterized protein CXQ87_000280 [Candidozyma duobushaemuli]|uniref:Translation initiation factor eIF2B subunit gamma n=2 Tax=Candidozyma TaxID=3303203 RepID=A0ABX8I5K2_9ASCO|nr:uncharacterized protein CXQ87_000280 [[Candida] duobushaemulonis]PVH17395.1 hypothetical protein CXQ87_000280 [[Candida] duobushaemulonis]QWU86036.1 hypothetical protein CA3LBN_000254 [[Candida] haemuloni]
MEFHAVILCGQGKALNPFSKVRATGTVKALLPIANKPMIEYVLDWCAKAFFPKITIVCDEPSKEDLVAALKAYKSKAGPQSENNDNSRSSNQFLDSIQVVESATATSGEVLKFLAKSNIIDPLEHFVLLPCDFITNLPPQVLIEAYRSRSETDIGLLCCYKNQLDIEDKKNKIFPKNYTIFAELPSGQSQLLDYYSAEDVDFHKALKIRTQLTWKYSKSIVSTKLLNSSIFFGSANEIFGLFEKYQDKFTKVYFSNRPLIKVIRDLARLSWQSTSCENTIGFMLVPTQAQFTRSNNLPVLLESNRYYLKLQAQANAARSSAPKDKTAANVGADALIGENNELGEKTNVKRTVVGNNCKIGKRVKLTGSIILDNAVIEDDVALENCIIGHDVIIRSKSKLVNCNVESTHEVAKGTQAKGDTLLCLSLEGLEVEDGESAIESSSEESSSGSDYDDYEEDIEYGDNSDGLFAY